MNRTDGYSLSMVTTEYWGLGQTDSSTTKVPLQVSPGKSGPSATTAPQMYGATSSDSANSCRHEANETYVCVYD